MQGAQIACWGWLGISALWAVRGGRLRGKTVARWALALLVLSMSATFGLVIADRKDILRTLLPLHLCSLSAFLTLPLLSTGRPVFLHFCWYLGLPGGVMALLFPAVAGSSWPNLMATTFMLTHALVVFAPLLWIAQGRLPRRDSAWPVLLAGNIFLAVTYIVDKLIDANYMFLLAAPPGTPLAWMQRLGQVGYLAAIELCAVLVVLGMRGVLDVLISAKEKAPARGEDLQSSGA